MTEHTLLLIKPNAIMHKNAGAIISMVEENGFVLKDMKVLQFDREFAAIFYIEHKGKDFYEKLLDFMSSGPTIALLLEKHNAVHDLRDLVGDTDPAERKPGTIRDRFAEGVTENAVHASDSAENARREIRLIFAYSPQ